MRKFLIASILLGLGYLAAQLQDRTIGLAQQNVPTISNGDCDGNGRRDISDAVSFLSWLFLGGQEPVTIQQNASDAPPAPLDIHCANGEGGIEVSWANPAPYDLIEIKKNGQVLASFTARETAYFDSDFRAGEVIDYSIRGRVSGVVSAPSSCSVAIPPPPVLGNCLVSTGLESCWGNTGQIDCSVPPARGQDGFYRRGCPPEDRFVDNKNGTVTDRCTGLMWMKKNVDVNGDFEINDKDRLLWLPAVQFVEDMTLAGYDDWRLPNVQELISIRDFGGPFTLYPVFDFYMSWTSTGMKENGFTEAYVIEPFSLPLSPVAFGKYKNEPTLLTAVRDEE